MPFEYAGHDYPTFQEYLVERPPPALSTTDGTPLYAHPIDGWIVRALNSTPVRAALAQPIDIMINFAQGHTLAGGVVVDTRSFPEVFKILVHCANTLGIPIPFTVAVHGGFNAGTAGTDEHPFILLYSLLLRLVPPSDLVFIIGHECGHIAARHAMYQTLLAIIHGTLIEQSTMGKVITMLGHLVNLPLVTIPLEAWSRRAEVTADRAGLLCCDDPDTALRALLRLVISPTPIESIDLDSFLRRFWEAREYYHLGQVHEFFIAHPTTARRIEALRLFAHSKLYYDLSGRTPPKGISLLTREELDRRVSQVVRP
jgi:Zn-dependent protease with chaperone function